MDTSIELKHPNDYEPEQGARFEVHFKKNRGFSGDSAKPILAQLSDGAFISEKLEIDLNKRIEELLQDGASSRTIADELDISQSTAHRKIQKIKRTCK